MIKTKKKNEEKNKEGVPFSASLFYSLFSFSALMEKKNKSKTNKNKKQKAKQKKD